MTKLSAAQQRYRHSEKGLAKIKAYRSTPEFKAKNVRKYHDTETWKRHTLSTLKYRAKLRGYDFNLTLDDLTIPSVCPVFKIPLKIGYGVKHLTHRDTPSVDRIDNEKGYTKDNIVIMSNRANLLKKDGVLAEFEAIVNYLRQV